MTSYTKALPGKPVAYNYGLLSVNYGLLRGIVAHYFGVPGTWLSMKSTEPAGCGVFRTLDASCRRL